MRKNDENGSCGLKKFGNFGNKLGGKCGGKEGKLVESCRKIIEK